MFSISVCKVLGNCLNFIFKISDLSLVEGNPSIVLRNAMREFCNLLGKCGELTLSFLFELDGVFEFFVTFLELLCFILCVRNSI